MPYVTGQLVALYFRGSMYSLYIDYPEERKEEGNASSRNASIMQSCPDYLTTADHTFSLCNFSQLPCTKHTFLFNIHFQKRPFICITKYIVVKIVDLSYILLF